MPFDEGVVTDARFLTYWGKARDGRYMTGIPSSKSKHHEGDIMSAEKRSALMSRIKGRDTGPERLIATALADLGLKWVGHARDLPGRPDFVFRDARVAVFVDGDFWHGWRFSQWRHKLSKKWEEKIAANRKRDARNHRKLRRAGWVVIRIWEHQINSDLAASVQRITDKLKQVGVDESYP